jgi:hypothetical protein
MLKRDQDDDATTMIESERRSIDEGWASLTDASHRDAEDGSDRTNGSEPAGDGLQAAYDAATRRAADWYSSRLEPEDAEMAHRDGGGAHRVSTSAPARARGGRTRPTAGVDR